MIYYYQIYGKDHNWMSITKDISVFLDWIIVDCPRITGLIKISDTSSFINLADEKYQRLDRIKNADFCTIP